jgi:hypothetical protein
MRVIFLDIDGVLNNRPSLIDGVEILPEKVLLIERICQETGAKVILSSAWRVLHPFEELQFVLACAGLSRRHLIGCTPRRRDDLRGLEIKEWIDEQNGISEDKVENFVIIDDDTDFLEEQMPHFIKTDIADGLTEDQAEKAIKMLNSERE